MISLKTIKISTAIFWIVGFVSLIAYIFEMLSLKYAVMISLTVFILQLIIIAAFIRKALKNPNMAIIMAKVIISKGKITDKHVRGKDDIFRESVRSVNPRRDGIFRIILELAQEVEKGPLKFYVVRKCQSNTCEQEIDVIDPYKTKRHIFDIAVDPEEKVNFKFNKDTMIKSFSVDELYMP